MGGRKHVNSAEGQFTANDRGEIQFWYKVFPPTWSHYVLERALIRSRSNRDFEKATIIVLIYP
jgi:hypothetical protein